MVHKLIKATDTIEYTQQVGAQHFKNADKQQIICTCVGVFLCYGTMSIKAILQVSLKPIGFCHT